MGQGQAGQQQRTLGVAEREPGARQPEGGLAALLERGRAIAQDPLEGQQRFGGRSSRRNVQPRRLSAGGAVSAAVWASSVRSSRS